MPVRMSAIKKSTNINAGGCGEKEILLHCWWECKLVQPLWSDPHLEPDTLECEVKWALGSITTNKAGGGDGMPVVLFQNPERWCCESAALNMPADFENSAVATGLEKVSFHSNPKERQCQRMLRLPHNCTHLTR